MPEFEVGQRVMTPAGPAVVIPRPSREVPDEVWVDLGEEIAGFGLQAGYPRSEVRPIETPAKHTAGPWEFDPEDGYVTLGTALICRVIQSDDFPCVDETPELESECQANGYLVSAAPELLEACRAALKQWLNDDNYGCGSDEDGRVATLLRQAIEKATGE